MRSASSDVTWTDSIIAPVINCKLVFYSPCNAGILPAVPHLFHELCVEYAGVGRGGKGVWVETWHRYGLLAGPWSCCQGNDGEEEDN